MNAMDRRERVLVMVGDAVMDLFYYDRKEDDDFPVGSIEKMVENGEITVDEMVARFRSELE